MPTYKKDKFGFRGLTKEKKSPPAQQGAMKEEKQEFKTRTEQLEQHLQQQRAWNEQHEHHAAQLQRTITELKSDKERLQNQAVKLQKNVDELRREKQSAENHASQLQAEKRSAENHATQLEKEIDSLRKEKAAFDDERRQLQQQLETSRTECRELEEKLEKTKGAQTKFQQESQARTADLRARLEETGKEREELERELASRSSEFAAMMASKEKERGQAVKRAQAAERRLAAKQDTWEKETSRLQSELETEMRLAEEFRRQLEKALQKDGEDFQRQLAEAMERVERRLEQVAEDLRLRHKQTGGEGFMDTLPADVKQLCLTIQRLVGGQGQNFAQALLGDQVSWDGEDLQEGGWFMTSRKFWLCIKRWVEVSSQSQGALPLTSQHLRLACSQLKVDPTTVLEMTPEHEQALEDNFAYLMENLRVVEVMPYLRSSPHMTSDAWSFLLEGQGDSQKVDRLLAVVYSMGEDGYRLLISALAASWNEHVLGVFPQDAAKEEALRKTGLPEYQETAPEPKARRNDHVQSTDDEGNDKDLTEDDDCTDEEIRGPAVGVITKALVEMEDRMVTRMKELVSSLGEVKGGELQAREVRAGLEAGGAAAARETAGAVAALQSQVAAVEAGVRDLAGVVEGRVGHVAERVEHVKDVVHHCFDEFYKDARVTLDKPAK